MTSKKYGDNIIVLGILSILFSSSSSAFCQQSQAAHYLNPSQASNFVPATSTAELEVLPTPLEAAAPSPEEADIFSEERDAPELDQTAIATDQTRPEEETRQPDKETRQPDEDTIPDLESGEDCALPEESLMGVATEPSVAEVCRGVLETIHPLHATWVMWYDQITTNNRSQLCDYEASLKTVSTVGCVSPPSLSLPITHTHTHTHSFSLSLFHC